MSRHILLACLAVVAVVSGWLFFAGYTPKKSEPQVVAPVAVTVAEVVQREIPLTISAVGRVEAKTSVAMKSRLDGQVVEVDFAEGQPVKKGQLLMRFDTAVLEAQRRQAEGILARDEAQLEKVKADYQRNLALVDQGFISQSGLSQSAADLHTAEANLRADRASLDNAQLQLSYARITAPMDGVAGALLLPVGGAAKFNDTTAPRYSGQHLIARHWEIKKPRKVGVHEQRRGGRVGHETKSRHGSQRTFAYLSPQ